MNKITLLLSVFLSVTFVSSAEMVDWDSGIDYRVESGNNSMWYQLFKNAKIAPDFIIASP